MTPQRRLIVLPDPADSKLEEGEVYRGGVAQLEHLFFERYQEMQGRCRVDAGEIVTSSIDSLSFFSHLVRSSN